jgi:DnaK suppressor protein
MPKAARKTARKTASTEFKNFEPYKPKRGEEYMNDKQRAHFDKILLDWRTRLIAPPRKKNSAWSCVPATASAS